MSVIGGKQRRFLTLFPFKFFLGSEIIFDVIFQVDQFWGNNVQNNELCYAYAGYGS
jgi:hypothetical protein